MDVQKCFCAKYIKKSAKFRYYKTTDQGQDHEFVFQEEVKRDGVKKGKSFLKSKALQLVFRLIDHLIVYPSPIEWIAINPENLFLLLPESDPVFHPPKA